MKKAKRILAGALAALILTMSLPLSALADEADVPVESPSFEVSFDVDTGQEEISEDPPADIEATPELPGTYRRADAGANAYAGKYRYTDPDGRTYRSSHGYTRSYRNADSSAHEYAGVQCCTERIPCCNAYADAYAVTTAGGEPSKA